MKMYTCANLGMYLQHASNFTTMEAIYEIVKNAEEGNDGIRADDIFICSDPKDKVFFVVGNGGGLNLEELSQEFMHIGESFKDEKHKGSGRVSFLKFSTRMIFISKKDDLLYIIDCIPVGTSLGAEIEPHQMTSADENIYRPYLRHLNRFKNGSIAIFEHVGDIIDRVSYKPHHAFEIEQEINPKLLAKDLQNKFRGYLRQKKKIVVKSGEERSIALKFDPGKGKELSFTCPSKDCKTCEGKDRCADRQSFFYEHGGEKHEYSLTVEFDLRITTGKSIEEDVYIHEDGQNARSMTEVFARSSALRGSKVFFNRDLGQYIHGGIDFIVTPLDGGPLLDLYTSDRTLNIGGAFSGFRDCLSNILIQAEYNKIRPAILDYIGARNKNKDEKEGELLTEELTFLWKNDRLALSAEFPEIFATKSQNDVPLRETICPSCGFKKEARRITLSSGQEVPKNGIFIVGEVYRCGNCGAEWGGNSKTTPTKTPETPAVAKQPTSDVPTKPRERIHGMGVTFHIAADRIDDRINRWYRRSATDVIINSNHPEHRKFSDLAKNRKNTSILRVYQRAVAAQALIEIHYSDPIKFKTPKVVELLEKLQSKILTNYFSFTKELRATVEAEEGTLTP